MEAQLSPIPTLSILDGNRCDTDPQGLHCAFFELFKKVAIMRRLVETMVTLLQLRD